MGIIKINKHKLSSESVILNGCEILQRDLGNIEAGTDINGMSVTELINSAFGDNKLSFFHISDTHGQNTGLEKCADLMGMGEAEFTIATGDLQLTSTMKSTIINSDKPFLTLYGNHDVVDDFGGSQINAAKQYVRDMCGGFVNLGSDIGTYWYKDVQTKARTTIRIITFDEWEFDVVGKATTGGVSKYQMVMSQAQIDWFISLLKNTPSHYYIIIAKHEPFAETRDTSVIGGFTSLRAPNNYEYSGMDNPLENGRLDSKLIPSILDAYLNKKTFKGTYYCGDLNKTQMSFNEDFSSLNPAKFLFYLCGHTHWDVCEYLPLFPNQLQLAVDCALNQYYQYSDLPRTDYAYLFNKVTIDFGKRKTIIKRYGASKKSDNTFRTAIEFPIL